MALATSVISARVGRGLTIMESSIWVAVMQILPALMARSIRCFWMAGISAKSISTPISPRATMMPSATVRISSMLSMPSWFSIFAMMRILELCSSRMWRISIMSCALRAKLAEIRSKPCSTPNRISLVSRWLIYGMDRCTPGTLTPFLVLMMPSLQTVQAMSVSPTSSMRSSIRPSSSMIRPPGLTSWGSSL